MAYSSVLAGMDLLPVGVEDSVRLEQLIWTEQDEALLKRFASLVEHAETIPLTRLGLQIAQAEYPDLLIDAVEEKFAKIADEVNKILPPEASDGEKITALNHYLFEVLSFKGDDIGYQDPKNTYLNDVLRRRTGLPISLSILYLDVAGRLSLSMIGVGLPGHFILRYSGSGTPEDVYVDPFHDGRVLTRRECEELVARLTGGQLPWHDDYLREV
ncbi:MAG: transglutaminase family protein, partial [Myxococcales bacterium]|nr:transglutaminase family protein [Myxococcales bacterium]